MNEIAINCVIGIDPGANGGIAVWLPDRPAKAVKMPKDLTDLRDFFAYYMENYRPIAFLEKLSVRPDDVSADGSRANMGKLYRIQKMMANFEHLKALLEVSGMPYVMVHPASWMSKLNLRIKGEEKADRKRRFVEIARKMYPLAKAALWNADALLIMHFGRVMLLNDMRWVLSNLPEREQEKLFK